MYALSLCMIQQVRSSKRGSTELYFSKMLAVFYNRYQGTTTILSVTEHDCESWEVPQRPFVSRTSL